MLTTIHYNKQSYICNLAQPIDVSIALREGLENVNAFYASPVHIEPVKAGTFIGDTKQGGSVNFKNVQFNPHGNGTHTECVGHIAYDTYTIHKSLQQFHFVANLISIYPQKMDNGDRVITKQQIMEALANQTLGKALIIRTLPNEDTKLTRQYSGTNPPYIHHEAMQYIVEQGFKHFLIDLPSVDREQDEGKLLAHKAFWQYPNQVRKNATITELIYVPTRVKDGLYLLNIQICSLELDASPSKPVLYKLAIRD